MRKTQAKAIRAITISLDIQYRHAKRYYTRRVPRPKRAEWLDHLTELTFGIGKEVAKILGPLESASFFIGDYDGITNQQWGKLACIPNKVAIKT